MHSLDSIRAVLGAYDGETLEDAARRIASRYNRLLDQLNPSVVAPTDQYEDLVSRIREQAAQDAWNWRREDQAAARKSLTHAFKIPGT